MDATDQARREATVLITGAAENLGGILARHLHKSGQALRLMYHRKPLPEDLAAAPDVTAVSADLALPGTLGPTVEGAGVIVHFAGVLFKPRPERFLPTTNTLWFANLVEAAIRARVGRVILISFPQVEGPTSFEHPAAGRLDREPISVHARTRLEEERLLFDRMKGTGTTPVVLRPGGRLWPGDSHGGGRAMARPPPAARRLAKADRLSAHLDGGRHARD